THKTSVGGAALALLFWGTTSCGGSGATPDPGADDSHASPGGTPAAAPSSAGGTGAGGVSATTTGAAGSNGSSDAGNIAPLPPPADRAGASTYAVFEQDFTAPSTGYANPWENVTVSMKVTSPTGRTTTVGGFFYSGSTYKARFRPDEAGT